MKKNKISVMRFKSVSFCSLLSILFSPKIDQHAAKKVHDFILSYYFTLRVHYIQKKKKDYITQQALWILSGATFVSQPNWL